MQGMRRASRVGSTTALHDQVVDPAGAAGAIPSSATPPTVSSCIHSPRGCRPPAY